MGRYITAEVVGNTKGNTHVHKFWFGAQPSDDIEKFLEVEEVTEYKAPLTPSKATEISATVSELKQAFKADHGLTYEDFIAKIDAKGYLASTADEETQTKAWKAIERSASTIDLGENLLATIENMKFEGVEYQNLDVEY